MFLHFSSLHGSLKVKKELFIVYMPLINQCNMVSSLDEIKIPNRTVCYENNSSEDLFCEDMEFYNHFVTIFLGKT